MTTILLIHKLTNRKETQRKIMRHLLFLTLMLSLPLHAGAIKKWVDEEGNVYYGDSPPIKAQAEDIRVQRAPSNPGKSLPRLSTQGSGDAGTNTAASAGDDSEVPRDQAQIACEQAQEDLRVISRSSRIKLRSADGTERYLTTEEITQRKQQAEADIERFCE